MTPHGRSEFGSVCSPNRRCHFYRVRTTIPGSRTVAWAEQLREKDTAILAVENHARELVAAAGITRRDRLKVAHRAMLWGVFVEPAHRGKRLGRAVVSAAVDLARTWEGVGYIDLGVNETAPHAQRLYESLGFLAWGREPASIQFQGRCYDEIYMALKLGDR